MDKVNGKLIVYFEKTFWVRIFEYIENDQLSVAKVIFGAEVKDYEVQKLIQKGYLSLKFSPSVDEVVKVGRKNPKRMQREVKKQMQSTDIGTKSQQELKIQHEQNKQEHKVKNVKEKKLNNCECLNLNKERKKKSIRGINVSLLFFLIVICLLKIIKYE